jgi:hypothetical protein
MQGTKRLASADWEIYSTFGSPWKSWTATNAPRTKRHQQRSHNVDYPTTTTNHASQIRSHLHCCETHLHKILQTYNALKFPPPTLFKKNPPPISIKNSLELWTQSPQQVQWSSVQWAVVQVEPQVVWEVEPQVVWEVELRTDEGVPGTMDGVSRTMSCGLCKATCGWCKVRTMDSIIVDGEQPIWKERGVRLEPCKPEF